MTALAAAIHELTWPAFLMPLAEPIVVSEPTLHVRLLGSRRPGDPPVFVREHAVPLDAYEPLVFECEDGLPTLYFDWDAEVAFPPHVRVLRISSADGVSGPHTLVAGDTFTLEWTPELLAETMQRV